MRRWFCCACGDGILAPEAPRFDDARRWCLRCSKRNGKLQPRTRATSLEEARALALRAHEQAAARRARREKKRAKEVAADIAHALSGSTPKKQRGPCRATRADPVTGTTYVCSRPHGHTGSHRDWSNGYAW